MHGICREGRGDARRRAAVLPRDDLSGFVEASLDTLHRDRVQEVVLNVIPSIAP